jgi:hypothetical protein
MTILFMESGSDAAQGLEFWDSLAGAASSSAQAHTGPRSIALTGAVTAANQSAPNGLAKNGFLPNTGRLSAYVRMGAQPTGVSAKMIGWGPNDTNNQWSLGRNSSGQLEYRVATCSQLIGTGTATPDAGVWVHIECAWTWTSSSANEFRLWIDGTLDITITNHASWTVGIGSNGDLVLGHPDNSSSDTTYLDDVYVDDDSSLTRPGDILVTAKLPAAANTSNFDTDGGTGAVNERPLSVTNYKQHAAATDVQQNYTLQAASVGDEDLTGATIVGYTGWVYAKRG